MKNKLLLVFLAALLPCATSFADVSPEIDAYLNPSRNLEIGMMFEAFLSPHQESGEEEDTPQQTPDIFKSTAPSYSRDQREANGHRGHALLRFTKDLSKAYVDVKLYANNLSESDEIVMFHLHCGRPGILGPIIIDFSLVSDDMYSNFMDDGVFSVQITNKDIVENSNIAEDIVGELSRGCIIPSPTLETLLVKTSTIAGLATIALEGELYFNLHTKGQTYYGDMRGQVYPIGSTSNAALRRADLSGN